MCQQLTKKLQLKPLQLHEKLSVWKRKGQNLTGLVPSRKSAFKLINFHQLLYQVKIIPNEFCSVSGKANSFFNWNSWRTTDFSNWISRWFRLISWELSSKVHIFWEGHKLLRNLHRRFVLCGNGSNLRWRFRKIFWPSQNMWTLTVPK